MPKTLLPDGVYEKGGIFFVPFGIEFASENKVEYRDTSTEIREYILENINPIDIEKINSLPIKAEVYVNRAIPVTTNEEFAIIWLTEGSKCLEVAE